ncbi:hypothetical protein D9758_009859 [Tetrapyrgos nigripes]|uniref:Uncharacterized protein n=1 Tax=Tetrapyrgos nigripes TaxID=182062 RepID=A0A8H5GMH4_9AGAR|nr:hypothetical protein D9758_009859 [Tetrapyrgos nigripes]
MFISLITGFEEWMASAMVTFRCPSVYATNTLPLSLACYLDAVLYHDMETIIVSFTAETVHDQCASAASAAWSTAWSTAWSRRILAPANRPKSQRVGDYEGTAIWASLMSLKWGDACQLEEQFGSALV